MVFTSRSNCVRWVNLAGWKKQKFKYLFVSLSFNFVINEGITGNTGKQI
jgi:hypothetical protein